MNYKIEEMKEFDWDEVLKIYFEGINIGIVIF